MGKSSIASFAKAAWPWVVMAGLWLLYEIFLFFESLSDDILDMFYNIITGVIVVVVVIVPVLLLVKLYKKLPRKERDYDIHDESFRHQPWLFNRKHIVVCGKIEKVFSFDPIEKLRQVVEHIRWALSGSSAPFSKHECQRFLVSSPQLIDNERMLICHDVRLGRQILGPGQWVEVCGVYIDSQPLYKGIYGSSLTFYGQVRSENQQLNYLKLLDKEPSAEELKDIQILQSSTPVSKGYTPSKAEALF